MDQCGGRVDEKYFIHGSASITVIFSNEKESNMFLERFKETEEYKKSEEGLREHEAMDFVNTVRRGFMQWTDDRLKSILANHDGWWRKRGTQETWDQLVVFLNERYITIEPHFYVEVDPPQDPDEWQENDLSRVVYECFHGRGNGAIQYMKWCAYHWLRAQGISDDEITFPTSLANIAANSKAISIKVGEGDPFQIIYHILADPEATYIHFPYGELPVLYRLKGTPRLYQFLQGDKFHRMFIANCIEINQQRKAVSYQEEELVKEKEQRELLEEQERERRERCILDRYEDTAVFYASEVHEFLQNDPSIDKSLRHSTYDDVKKWIKSLELYATKHGNRWVVSKQHLVQFIKWKKNPPNRLDWRRWDHKLKIDFMEYHNKAVREQVSEDLVLYNFAIKHELHLDDCKLSRTMNFESEYDEEFTRFLRLEDPVHEENLLSEIHRYVFNDRYISETATAVEHPHTPDVWDDPQNVETFKNHALNGIKAGTSMDNIFNEVAELIVIPPERCKQYWYLILLPKIRETVEQIRSELYPEWDSKHDQLLIDEMIDGARTGQTVEQVVRKVSALINIPSNKLKNRWNTALAKQYREEITNIKKELENSWGEEHDQKLTALIKDAGVKEGIDIARKELQRHLHDVVKRVHFLGLTKDKLSD
ncbi:MULTISPECIES: hypothetical protein [unclassified Paenibacillus]|uniref:hypothetical protein n=1 Tax=unclassified Paenibacillus TaxID=185978 RepID=UPI002783FE56|nr:MULTISPECIES: hypothetical protein [unclassified Paenibacillus]MDQ0896319.1 hypothetical protein [Paenibacillus sp. V4I7]MDQ0913754.1 hypothetical protein [Paenibacillus sp. V4I5]